MTRQPSQATMERYADSGTAMEANQAAFNSIRWEDQDESRKQRLVPLPGYASYKYVFRVKPGTLRQFAVRIPTLPDDYKSDRAEKVYTERFNKRSALRENGKYDLDKVREAVGGDWIAFKAIPGNENRQESSFYPTNDEDVYRFLMRCKELDTSGNWDNIFVEYPGKTIEVNGKQYPSTEAGWQAAQAAMMADESTASE